MTLSSNMSLQSTITSCFEGFFFTVNCESQNFKAGHMLQMGQASYGCENVIYCFFLIISIDWVRPGILLQKNLDYEIRRKSGPIPNHPWCGRNSWKLYKLGEYHGLLGRLQEKMEHV